MKSSSEKPVSTVLTYRHGCPKTVQLYRESACGGRYIGVVSGLVGVVALVGWGRLHWWGGGLVHWGVHWLGGGSVGAWWLGG